MILEKNKYLLSELPTHLKNVDYKTVSKYFFKDSDDYLLIDNDMYYLVVNNKGKEVFVDILNFEFSEMVYNTERVIQMKRYVLGNDIYIDSYINEFEGLITMTIEHEKNSRFKVPNYVLEDITDKYEYNDKNLISIKRNKDQKLKYHI